MTSDIQDRPASWDAILFRTSTDAQFRQSLISNPSGVLRELGLLAEDETVTVYDLTPGERLLVLPPFVGELEQQRMLRSSNAPEQVAPATRQATNEGRAPYSQTPPSPPIIGPAAVALTNPQGLSRLA
jgi:hypothetical protein